MSILDERPIFFWIMLEERLDPLFYEIGAQLKEHGVELLPVKADQVSRLIALTETSHVVLLCSTRRVSDFAPFLRHVAPRLPLLLRQDRLSFFHLSSFSKLQVASKRPWKQSYFFFKYPLNLVSLCAKLRKYQQLKTTQTQKWPGGRRAKVPGLAV